jgi:hypothetical protein
VKTAGISPEFEVEPGFVPSIVHAEEGPTRVAAPAAAVGNLARRAGVTVQKPKPSVDKLAIAVFEESPSERMGRVIGRTMGLLPRVLSSRPVPSSHGRHRHRTCFAEFWQAAGG